VTAAAAEVTALTAAAPEARRHRSMATEVAAAAVGGVTAAALDTSRRRCVAAAAPAVGGLTAAATQTRRRGSVARSVVNTVAVTAVLFTNTSNCSCDVHTTRRKKSRVHLMVSLSIQEPVHPDNSHKCAAQKTSNLIQATLTQEQ